jgi:hypothetical protein
MTKLFSLLLLFLPTFAAAGWTSGNELNTRLNEGESSFYQAGLAMGYITAIADISSRDASGIFEMIGANDKLTPEKKRELLMFAAQHHTCIPSGVTVGQLVATVKKWLSLHPERWNEDAADLVQDAFIEGFPCKSVNDFMK